MLPNQGSNLDFTDPESVVLPITPLGICGCKDSKNFEPRTKNLELFLIQLKAQSSKFKVQSSTFLVHLTNRCCAEDRYVVVWEL